MDERIYRDQDTDEWFYRTRGNHAVGPFSNRHQAEQALNKQIRHWSGGVPLAAWPRQLNPSRIFRRSATRHS